MKYFSRRVVQRQIKSRTCRPGPICMISTYLLVQGCVEHKFIASKNKKKSLSCGLTAG